jgi:hypothetical protein
MRFDKYQSTNKILLMILLLGIYSISSNVYAQESSINSNPKTEGRPVFMADARVIVFPEGVDKPTQGYRGTIGAVPLALIKINNLTVGEIYSSVLKGNVHDESKELIESAKKNPKMQIVKNKTEKYKNDTFQEVTLKINLKSRLGSPWILHSLYFPVGKSSSTTFKLVCSEKNYQRLLPYFKTMLFIE